MAENFVKIVLWNGRTVPFGKVDVVIFFGQNTQALTMNNYLHIVETAKHGAVFNPVSTPFLSISTDKAIQPLKHPKR